MSDARLIGSTDDKARPTSQASGIHGGAVAAVLLVLGPRLSGLHPRTGGIGAFLDSGSQRRASTIEAAIMHLRVSNRMPCVVVQSPTFIALPKALRPVFVYLQLFRNRNKKVGPGLITFRVGEHVPDVLTPRNGACFNS